MESQLVTIASYTLKCDAEAAAALLEERNIPTRLRDSNMNLLHPGLVDIRLQVPPEFEERAVEILDAEGPLEP